jgi:hypothetical protein
MPRRQPTFNVAIAPPGNPTTPAEWQNAFDAASALLALHSARAYGLVTGGPAVYVERLAGEIGVAPGGCA